MDQKHIKIIISFLLLCIANCQSSYSSKIIDVALDRATEFFQKLKSDYGSLSLDTHKFEEIDNKIKRFTQNNDEFNYFRRKRTAPTKEEKGINVLKEFSNTLSIKIPNVKDIIFFPYEDKFNLLWFVATINASGISLYELKNDNVLYPVTTYSQKNVTRVIVDSSLFGVFLIFQKRDSVVIYRLGTNKLEIQSIQELEHSDVMHVSTWYGMNQLYLGIGTKSNVLIYTWLGEHFDLVQILEYGANKIIPFDNKGFMHLIISRPQETFILKFDLHLNKFVVIQKLPAGQDITYFYLKKDYFFEQFLVLLQDSSTIIYKEMHNRFVPFQQIEKSTKSISLVYDKTILLTVINKDTGTFSVYQYDGWRFVKLDIQNFNVGEIHKIKLHSEESLLVKDENGNWNIKTPKWVEKKSWQTMLNDMQSWCDNAIHKAQRKSVIDSNFGKTPARILHGYINQLRVHNVNNEKLKVFQNLTHQYKSVLSRLQRNNNSLKGRQFKHYKFKSLYAEKVRLKCESQCKVNRLITEEKTIFDRLRNIGYAHQNLKFEHIKVDNLNITYCPVPDFALEEVIVNGPINNNSWIDLQKNALRVIGNQEVSGQHTYHNLQVRNASLPLDIAVHSTKQKIIVKAIKTKVLNLTQGGLLLPLNGPPTVMPGTIIASKIKIKNPIHLQGKPSGAGLIRFLPVTETLNSMNVTGDFTLRNVIIRNVLQTDHLSRDKGKSLNDILINTIPLNRNVPIHVKFSQDHVKWDNVILMDYQNWITAGSDRTVISGTKYIPRNITLANSTFASLPIPRLSELCAAGVIVPAINYSSMTIDHIFVKKMESLYISGAKTLNDLIFDTASLNTVDLSTKRFIGEVAVKNITISSINNISNLKELEEIMNKWVAPDRLKGVIKAKKLKVNMLEIPVRFKIPLPSNIRNMISKENLYADMINGVDIPSFMTNVIQIQHAKSLGNITFANGFESNEINVNNSPINFKRFGNNNLGSKKISGMLITDKLNIPYKLNYAPENTSSCIIQGTVTFQKEPILENINDMSMKKLINDAWMKNEPTTLRGTGFNMKNVTFKEDIILTDLPRTPNLGTWQEVSEKVLSKSKPQNISVTSYFNRIQAPNVVGSKTSMIKSSVPSLNETLENSLMKNGSQKIESTLGFHELRATGNLVLNGKINNMNLTTDFVRNDVEQNIVTGKKTIVEINTEYLNGLNFDTWVEKAFIPERYKKHEAVNIKGQKVFHTIHINKLSVVGSIMGSRLENALLKSRDQEIFGVKKINGTIKTPSIEIDGLINDVNLTSLVNDQLKKRPKHNETQKFKTKLELRKELEIIGDLTVDDLYQGVSLKDFNKENQHLESMLSKTVEYVDTIEGIDTALQNRAIYINKLQIVKKDSITPKIDSVRNIEEALDIFGQCKISNASSACNEILMAKLYPSNEQNDLIMIKSIPLEDTKLSVLVKSNSVSIYLFDSVEDEFQLLKDLYIPGILEASMESSQKFLWIVLRLSSKMLLLRYNPRISYQQYVLPKSDTVVINKTPYNQLLMLRSDGMWELDGLMSPRNIFEADLSGQMEVFSLDNDRYVKLTRNNTIFLKARYVGEN